VTDRDELESAARRLGDDLLADAQREQARLTTFNRWTRQVLEWCLANPEVKASMLRFLDCLPGLTTPNAVIRHVREYFPRRDLRLPPSLRLGAGLAGSGLLGARPAAAAVRMMTEEIARQFVAGSGPDQAATAVDRLAARGWMTSLDVLGEDVLTEPEADAYAQRYVAMLDTLAVERPDPPALPPEAGPFLHVSVKPSALAPRFDALRGEDAVDRAWGRLERIVAAARRSGAGVTLDMEQFAVRDLTLELARRLMAIPESRAPVAAGVVVQAYLADAGRSTRVMLEAARAAGRPITVRLVKGAYWDSEVALARQADREPPVLLRKEQTDTQFESLAELLLGTYPDVRLAVGSHNVRSIAHAMAAAERLGVSPGGVEFQFLFGMGDAIAGAVRDRGYPVRIYAPVGALIPGMGYLVRRLLENTANESFLRLADQGAVPAVAIRATARIDAGRGAGCAVTEFADPGLRDALRAALDQVRGRQGEFVPLLIGKREVVTGRWLDSVNPAHPGTAVARAAMAGPAEVEAAAAAARDAWSGWREAGPARRAQVLRDAAQRLEERRMWFAALEILEVGKTWREADADVAEAVSHLRHAAGLAAAEPARGPAQRPGESNREVAEPRGVVAAITPWNFPAAIPAGIIAPALAAGNPVILKPSSQASAAAYHLVRLLREAGVPPGILQYLPGPGRVAGLGLANHPDVAVVAFTGSRSVGLELMAAAATARPGQWCLKQTVLELGGKNAIIVDDDADPDAAIAGILSSAFGYGGQKCSACSRVILVQDIAEAMLPRLAAALDAWRVGDPAEAPTDMGPLIDAAAVQRVADAVAAVHDRGRMVHLYPAERLPHEGFYAPPVIATGLAAADPVAAEELFAPVLCVLVAPSFAAAIDLAMDSPYALTGGVYSRSPAHLKLAADRFQVGNLYFNRGITGAVVGRQPFGGARLSGDGHRSGGPDALAPYRWHRTITENTSRHGMPLDSRSDGTTSSREPS